MPRIIHLLLLAVMLAVTTVQAQQDIPAQIESSQEQQTDRSTASPTGQEKNQRPPSAAELRRMLHLAEYIGADYAEAVVDGEVVDINQNLKILDFAGDLVKLTGRLEPSTAAREAQQMAAALQQSLGALEPVETIQYQSTLLRKALLQLTPEITLPNSILTGRKVKRLYKKHCAACHGEKGYGDGPLARGMQPLPTDFHDRERADNLSLLGLYTVISEGIDGTSMAAYPMLDSRERWSLAIYVGKMAYLGTANADPSEIDLESLVLFSPNVLVADSPRITPEMVAVARTRAAAMFSLNPAGVTAPLEVASSQLNRALVEFRAGRFDSAQSLAISAYLDGYDLIRSPLIARDRDLSQSIEKDLLQLRSKLNTSASSTDVELHVLRLQRSLREAQELLEGTQLSNPSLLFASLLIFLRECFETLLIVVSLAAILINSGHSKTLYFLHLGWISALGAGLLTWFMDRNVAGFSGATRELSEGSLTLVAASALLLLGLFMQGKSDSGEWRRSVVGRIPIALRWSVTLLAFIAVYREAFELMLRYEALMTQSAVGQRWPVWLGIITGITILVGLGELILRGSKRLPQHILYRVLTSLLLLLAFVLAGKGILSLQDATVIPTSSVRFPTVGWLGINPTLQGLSTQFLIVLISLVLLFRYLVRKRQQQLSAKTRR